jgi:endonuclease III-like uncharacterized protein
MRKDILLKRYNDLLKTYGPQGWWPLLELHNSKNNKKGCKKSRN